jgi:4-hydroxy-tetrahydrodipicolinate reductase
MVKIALIGYGKMGLEIEKSAISRGHEIIHAFNRSNPVTIEKLSEADVAIEFTQPEAAVNNIQMCFQASCPVIVGTTGWYPQFDAVKLECEAQNGSLLYATNFSLGVNISFFLNGILAKIMSHYPDYNAKITEIHHTKKMDSPSGTAISLAEGIIENHPSFKEWELNTDASFGPKLPIEALREGEVPGTHIVTFSSAIDSITLKHEAFNRTGFALGSVIAAEWLSDKKGVYSMKDMLNFDALIQ